MTCCSSKAESERTFNPKLEELDWLTEELYLKARALESRINMARIQGIESDWWLSSV